MPIYKDFRYTEKEDHIIIRAYCGDDVDVIVPDTIKGKPVQEISSFAFVPEDDLIHTACNDYKKHCSKRIKSIHLPDSILRLDLAFSCCFELEKILIPPKAELIGDNFHLCYELQEIGVLDDHPQYTSRNGILYSKDGKKLLRCPPGHSRSMSDVFVGVEEIGPNAFEFCKQLESIHVPNTVTRIESLAFANCHNLSVVQLHENIHLVGGAHFWCCKSLDNVVYYNAEEVIPEREFYSCPSLRTIEVRGKVRTIGEGAFSSSGVVTFDIPNGVTAINRHAFLHCNALKMVSLPRSVSRIHKDAFTCSGKRYYSEEQLNDMSTCFGMKPATTFVVVPGSKAEKHCQNQGYTTVHPEGGKESSTVNWNTVAEADLKDIDYLVNAFGRYLKKECQYTPEQAKFTKDVIDDPYRYPNVNKQYETTAVVCGTEYEVYFCKINDCGVEKYFTFYMLIDVNTISHEYEEERARVLAKKKYILVK